MVRGTPVHQAFDDFASPPHLVGWCAVVVLIYLLACALALISSGLRIATVDSAKDLFSIATNPFIGLLIGITSAALLQSSSTVTAIIVGLTAGGLPVSVAVPMVMGANVGTTITNTIVSLGHIRRRKAFQRAFAAATIHDQFNLLSVLIFLPLEITFGVLEKLGHLLANKLVGESTVDIGRVNFLKTATHPVVEFVTNASTSIPNPFGGVVVLLIGVMLIFVSITSLSRQLNVLLVGPARRIMDTAIGRGPLSGIGSGAVVTMIVQSSSTTTSLVVPLVGTGIYTLRQIYPFVLGANIGTCVTALLAATAVDGAQAYFALQIALIHLLYNVLGVAAIFSIPFLREIPIANAQWLAHLATKNFSYVATYIGGVYFVIPGIFIYVASLFQ